MTCGDDGSSGRIVRVLVMCSAKEWMRVYPGYGCSAAKIVDRGTYRAAQTGPR
jgi:hypothetical protein